MLFPLNSERDYATEVYFPGQSYRFTLPSVHSQFLAELLKCVDTNLSGLDFILYD